jgi:hypothetical protein
MQERPRSSERQRKYETKSTHLTRLDWQHGEWSQTACNVSGLVHSLAGVIDRVWRDARDRGEGTAFVNGHPLVRLDAEQILYLSSGTSWEDAMEIVRKHQEASHGTE